MRLGYARVSTDEQADALTPQVSRLELAGCDRVITDIESGTHCDREGLLEAMALIRAGDVRELVITRVDRLGRDAAATDQLLALCESRSVTVRALDGGTVETATPQGFLMSRLLTSMAEVESRMLSLRLRRQFAAYRAQGRHLRRRMPFGYVGGPDHRLAPHPENWSHALRVIAELRRVRSFGGVARILPTWCPWTPAASSLQGWFTNPIIRGHVGHLRQGGKGWDTTWGEIHYDQHPALISEADWQELADDLRRTRSRFTGPTINARHGLTGLLVCASCGHRLRRNTAQGTAWWRCRHRLCTARGGIREQQVLPLVVAACVEAADQLALAAAATPDEDPALIGKRRDLEAARALASRNPSLAPMVAALEQEIRQIERRPVVTPDVERFAGMMRDPQFFSGATAEQQRAIFGALLREVQIGPGGQPLVMVPRR